MDWSLAIREERAVLKRIAALFYALAFLADSVHGRSCAVRGLVLWILRPAIAVALDYIADAGPLDAALVRESRDSIAEARRFSRCFRAAARSVKGLIKALDRCEDGAACFGRDPSAFGVRFGGRFAGHDLLASLRNLSPAIVGLSDAVCGSVPLLPERRDSS